VFSHREQRIKEFENENAAKENIKSELKRRVTELGAKNETQKSEIIKLSCGSASRNENERLKDENELKKKGNENVALENTLEDYFRKKYKKYKKKLMDERAANNQIEFEIDAFSESGL
jgi:hypothetical protein